MGGVLTQIEFSVVYVWERKITKHIYGAFYYLPIQNLPNIFDKTSSDISSPLICPRDNAASLKSIVQKSKGNSSFIDDCNLVSASLVRTSCSHCLCNIDISDRNNHLPPPKEIFSTFICVCTCIMQAFSYHVKSRAVKDQHLGHAG